jgi:antibiotic biosynthesis monooxygenase (ABM) superfamily enzyme
MIYITQLIYIIPGQEEIFNQFEDIAIPLISKYNGRLLLRVRPSENAFIEHHIAKPYEIHFVVFDTQQDFENFKQDEERNKYLHLKEQSIKESIMFQGTKL